LEAGDHRDWLLCTTPACILPGYLPQVKQPCRLRQRMKCSLALVANRLCSFKSSGEAVTRTLLALLPACMLTGLFVVTKEALSIREDSLMQSIHKSASRHPYGNVAIAAVYNTRQARILEGYTSTSLQIEAALGVLDAAGLGRDAIDGVAGFSPGDVTFALGLGPVWLSHSVIGIRSVVSAAQAISAGLAETVLIVDGAAGLYTQRDSTAPWTRPGNEFVVSQGMFTAVEFAFIARRHMELYGTTSQQLAKISATIRNNGHVNPEAVYFDRGPFVPEDILASRMVADPFHLLDCSMTSEGGIAIIVTTTDRARDLPLPPVYIFGAGFDSMGGGYQQPPSWDLHAFNSEEFPLGCVGRRAAQKAFSTAGLLPSDVDLCEFYDAFSFEVVRQLEAFGFCGEGEGGPFVEAGNIDPDGLLPINTDGGLLSFNHSFTAPALQRVGRAAQQLQGVCATRQVEGAEVALASNFGAGAMSTDVILLGTERP
jgi:acetyl-CoA acetyltransferase